MGGLKLKIKWKLDECVEDAVSGQRQLLDISCKAADARYNGFVGKCYLRCYKCEVVIWFIEMLLLRSDLREKKVVDREYNGWENT